jgi:hypothetical protein
VIVGIQPDVAVAMVHFHLNLEPLRATLDLDEALAYSIASRRKALGMKDEVRVPIASDADLVPARAHALARGRADGLS